MTKQSLSWDIKVCVAWTCSQAKSATYAHFTILAFAPPASCTTQQEPVRIIAKPQSVTSPKLTDSTHTKGGFSPGTSLCLCYRTVSQ